MASHVSGIMVDTVHQIIRYKYSNDW